jgi:hypothetical protein
MGRSHLKHTKFPVHCQLVEVGRVGGGGGGLRVIID